MNRLISIICHMHTKHIHTHIQNVLLKGQAKIVCFIFAFENIDTLVRLFERLEA